MKASSCPKEAHPANFGFDLIKYMQEFTEDSILIVDRNFTLRYANSSASRLFGHPEISLIGKSLKEIWRGTSFQRSQEKLRQALDQGIPVGFDTSA